MSFFIVLFQFLNFWKDKAEISSFIAVSKFSIARVPINDKFWLSSSS